jgi:predicted DNA-binding transcriptional regulator YafY
MRYFSASRNATARRNVDPYRLWYAQGALYLIGYCHLRHDVRLFSVDRIRTIAMTNEPCQLPLGFDVDEYVKNAMLVMRGAAIDVRLQFDRKVAPWVRDREWHRSQRLEPGPRGALLMTLRVGDTAELVGWILSFGGRVKVLSPESLRGRVHDEARQILRET